MKNFMIMVLEKAVGFAMKVVEIMRLKKILIKLLNILNFDRSLKNVFRRGLICLSN